VLSGNLQGTLPNAAGGDAMPATATSSNTLVHLPCRRNYLFNEHASAILAGVVPPP
jgi:hypothetical protein